MMTIDVVTGLLREPTLVLLVKATLLLGGAAFAAAALQRASAGTRHVVWLGMLGGLLILPALSSWGPVPVRMLAPTVAATVTTVSAPTDLAPSAPDELAQGATGPAPASSAATPAPAWSGTRILLVAWAVVACALLAWLAWGFVMVRGIVRRSAPLDGRDWTGPLYEIADRHGLEQAPRLVVSEEVAMPFACGFREPVIVLPRDAATWTLERRRAVLMHELAHVRRRDLAGHTLGRIACALWWFHPLAWMAARRLRIESEKACDDLALTCGLAPSVYAEHLLDIVSGARRTAIPAPAIAMAHRREFEGRMLAILDPALRRHDGRARLVWVGASLAALVVVVGAARPAPRMAAASLATRELPSFLGDTGTSLVSPPSTPRIADPVAPVAPRAPETSAPQPLPVSGDAGALVRALSSGSEGQAPDERVDALLRVLASDTSARVRRVAAWGLHEYAEDRADVATALATALRRDADAEVREMAAWALAQAEGNRAAIDALTEAVRRETNSRVRESAAWALASVDEDGAASVLASAVSDTSARMRETAIWAIGMSEPKSLPAPVIEALRDGNAAIRRVAAWALFQTGDAAALPTLEAAIAKETDPSVQRAFVRALGAIGEPAAKVLARMLDTNDPQVRESVVAALAGSRSGPWPWPRPRPRPSP